MQFIVEADNIVIKNNTKVINKYNSNINNANNTETKTYQMLKQFYSDYEKDNSFSSKFKEYILFKFIDYIVIGVLSFLLGLFSHRK